MRADVMLDMQGEPGRSYPVTDDFYDRLAYTLVRLFYEPARPVRLHPLDAQLRLPPDPVPHPDLTNALVGGPVAAEPKMHFGPILLHKILDPENAAVPEARSNPNGTERMSHANVLLGSTSMGHDRLWWFSDGQLSGIDALTPDIRLAARVWPIPEWQVRTPCGVKLTFATPSSSNLAANQRNPSRA
jgi:hypothetical protein